MGLTGGMTGSCMPAMIAPVGTETEAAVASGAAMPTPRATYRVQLHAGFTFDDAAAIVDYLADLGISHLYCSPFLQAAPGSTHGYDVVDHHRLNAELGGEEAYERLCQALAARGMSQVVDIVPNHMAISGRENTWWWDVLENGPSSRYASYFDIDWDPPEERMRLRVLMPVLGDHVGRVIDRGELALVRDGGSFEFRYFDHAAPVSPRSLDDLLGQVAGTIGSDTLASIAVALGRLPPSVATDRQSVEERHRDKEVLRANLAELFEEQPAVAAAVDDAVAVLNSDGDAVDGLLERQNFRLAYWRVAGQELDYRRFFDITSLIALRSENLFVFADTHEKMIELVRDGKVTGLRVDHVDGLRQPAEYLRLLCQAAGPGTYLVVEKILEQHESLPADWDVDGTTGYDFLARVNGLFVDPAGEEPLSELYSRFIELPAEYRAMVHRNKHRVMREVLAADVNRLTNLLVWVCDRHRRHRDHTRQDLSRAVREVLASLEVYRTYARPGGVPPSPADVARVDEAIHRARRRRPEIDADLFDFLKELFLCRCGGPLEDDFALRVQQLSGAVMAKGVEDTTFYQFNRLVSLNEVGGDPGRFGTSVEQFHADNARMAEHWPATMLATSTHDTKRSEDVRARISLLSELPEQWAAAVRRWAQHNQRHKTDAMPERNAEYLLYQVLVGAHPLDADRAAAFMEKAAREAKQHTSWIDPDPDYEAALAGFVRAVVADEEFVADLAAFVEPLVVAGRVTSLAQTLLKLTSPGVPDVYQGTDLWDLSLVDPDNRRPVDYEVRRRLLDKVRAASPAEVLALDDQATAAESGNSGAPKLWLLHRALGVRRRYEGAFAAGSGYRPLRALGRRAAHVVAYTRGDDVAVVVPRLVLGMAGDWADTAVELPPGRWTDELGGQRVVGGLVDVAALLSGFPVALLVRNGR
jgi:(1->4)-alpha-D-glucan 1-alpha-D-glucosylmutase